MGKAPVEAVDDIGVGLAERVRRTRVVVVAADVAQPGRREDARGAQAHLLERDRLAHLAVAQPQVRGQPGRGRGQLIGRQLLVLVAPAPVLVSPLGHEASLGVTHRATAVPLALWAIVMAQSEPVSPPQLPEILARGPWSLERVNASWLPDAYDAPPERVAAADAAIAALRERSSPSHDGVSARLVSFRETGNGLELELQPVRWALRLVPENASDSMAALCLTRSADGRWLAGRRAAWLSSWAGRWALGAGGAVDLGESPTDTLTRELQEEWNVAPERVRAEALIRLPQHLTMFVGVAWLAEGAEVTPDDEHDAYAWWPADIDRWPAEADIALRRMARWLSE